MKIHENEGWELSRYALRVVLSEIEKQAAKEIDIKTLTVSAPEATVANVKAQRAAKKTEKGKPRPSINFVGIAQKDAKDPAVLVWGSAAVAKAIASEEVQKKAQGQGVKFVGSVLYCGENMEKAAAAFAASVMPKEAAKAEIKDPAKTGKGKEKDPAKTDAKDDAVIAPPAE